MAAKAAILTSLALTFCPIPALGADDAKTRPFKRFNGSLGLMLNSHQSAEGGISNKTKYLSLNAAIGYQVTPKTRVSIRLDDRQNKYTTKFTIPSQFTQTFENQSVAVSLEGHRTLWRKEKLSINLGAGLGLEKSKLTQTFDYLYGNDPFVHKYSFKRLRVNGSIGISYSLSQRFGLQADYRVNRIVGDGYGDLDFNQTYHGLTLSLTLFASPQ